jgi:hypothetical protein
MFGCRVVPSMPAGAWVLKFIVVCVPRYDFNRLLVRGGGEVEGIVARRVHNVSCGKNELWYLDTGKNELWYWRLGSGNWS